jgi:peroxiredoxin
LLVHWSFECGFCDSIAADLARLETSFEKQNVQLVLLAYGEVRSNQEQAAEHGLKCPILLMKNDETPKAFERYGTPVAYLLDEEGRVDAPLASGADRVISLARAVAGSSAALSLGSTALLAASESAGQGAGLNGVRPQHPGLPSPGSADLSFTSSPLPPAQTPGRHRVKLPRFMVEGEIGLGDVIKRVTSAFGIKPCVGCERRAALLNRWLSFSGATGNGIKAGEHAPLFRLPDLQGRIITLEDYRGRRVFLVFTDPQCGPCDELAPHLVRLHREHERNGLAVILVGRGKAEENRRKAEQHGFHFPVLLQDRKWKVSKEYGILATPVAFLIGEDGVIAQDVAVGKEPILALARAGARKKA